MINCYRLPAGCNRKIGRAMHDYSMFTEGDRVLIAVSGGVDSLVLAWILQMWQKKAPIQFALQVVHVTHFFDPAQQERPVPGLSIIRQLQPYGLDVQIVPEWPIPDNEKRTCFLCSRNRRSQLFTIARETGCNKLALGHHKDDLIETFMLNAVYSGNISTMVPKQDLFNGSLSIVRPMAYLDKNEVIDIASDLGLEAVESGCHLAADTRREKVRHLLQSLYRDEPAARDSLFAALANVRKDYLL